MPVFHLDVKSWVSTATQPVWYCVHSNVTQWALICHVSAPFGCQDRCPDRLYPPPLPPSAQCAIELKERPEGDRKAKPCSVSDFLQSRTSLPVNTPDHRIDVLHFWQLTTALLGYPESPAKVADRVELFPASGLRPQPALRRAGVLWPSPVGCGSRLWADRAPHSG